MAILRRFKRRIDAAQWWLMQHRQYDASADMVNRLSRMGDERWLR